MSAETCSQYRKQKHVPELESPSLKLTGRWPVDTMHTGSSREEWERAGAAGAGQCGDLISADCPELGRNKSLDPVSCDTSWIKENEIGHQDS